MIKVVIVLQEAIDSLIKEGNDIYYCSEAGSPLVTRSGPMGILDSLNENLGQLVSEGFVFDYGT